MSIGQGGEEPAVVARSKRETSTLLECQNSKSHIISSLKTLVTKKNLDSDMVSGATKDMNKLVVEIVSKENISPASPTPDHLRTYKTSVFDQTSINKFVPLMLFYLNDQTSNLDTVISDRSKLLKESLSETLSRFYPFAGKVKDELKIDCNDEGVHYIETRVNTRLPDFLSQSPEYELIGKLVPENARESPIGNYVVVIQVNSFDCGGFVICTCINHKFIDGTTYTLFMKDWSAATRGSSDILDPCFNAPTLFPQIPSLLFKNPMTAVEKEFVTKRFVFSGSNIIDLKTKTSLLSSGTKPTRFDVVAALAWKCVAKAAYKLNNSYVEQPFNLAMLVNLREKNCVPKNTVGNLVWSGLAQSKLESGLEHHYLVDQIKKCKGEINNDFVDTIMGDIGTSTILKIADMMNSDEISVSLWITSMCNMDIYEIDFGWGKPVWFYFCNLFCVNFISLCDTRDGGVQAVVSLSEEEMAIFENDQELLSFASVNPSPVEGVTFS